MLDSLDVGIFITSNAGVRSFGPIVLCTCIYTNFKFCINTGYTIHQFLKGGKAPSTVRECHTQRTYQ